MTLMTRFHPLITNLNGVTAWYVCDGHADTEHSLAVPYIDEPCADRDEALALCEVLNEEDAILAKG